MRTLLAIVLLVVTGCVTDDQMHADRLAADRQKCSDYGFKPATDGFANCMMQLDKRRRAAAAAILLGRPAPVVPPTLPKSETTTCAEIGNTLRCTRH